MLIRRQLLERIKSGDVTLAYRRWRKPTVKAGGTLTTAVGVLSIGRVDRISERQVSAAGARRAGYDDRMSLIRELRGRAGDLYRIELSYAGADPRVWLRAIGNPGKAELDSICERLRRMDAGSARGAWTHRVLLAIGKYPELPAAQLAGRLDTDRQWLKPKVRKLKNLGLTVSHRRGYTLSPRGEAVLRSLRRRSGRRSRPG